MQAWEIETRKGVSLFVGIPAFIMSLWVVAILMAMNPIVGLITPIRDLYPHSMSGRIGENHQNACSGAR